MAEGDISFYNNAKEQILLGAWNFGTGGNTFRVVLLGSGYSFVATGNPGYASISANEISTTGYTAAGLALTSQTVAQNDTSNWANFDAADVTWASLGTTTIAHAVIYNDTITTPVADPLVCRVEIGTNSNGNDYTISWHTNGIFYLA